MISLHRDLEYDTTRHVMVDDGIDERLVRIPVKYNSIVFAPRMMYIRDLSRSYKGNSRLFHFSCSSREISSR